MSDSDGKLALVCFPQSDELMLKRNRQTGQFFNDVCSTIISQVFVWQLLIYTSLSPAWAASVNPSLFSLHQALGRGDHEAAESGFQRLLRNADPKQQSQAWAGLAAVIWYRGDLDRALDLTAQAESLDPENVYSHVVRGHIHWTRGQMEKAKSIYRTAMEKTNGEPWQSAIAANRVGRIYAIQGFGGMAENFFDRAINMHRDQAVFYVNKANLLEILNRTGEALELYSKALRLEPNDRLAKILL